MTKRILTLALVVSTMLLLNSCVLTSNVVAAQDLDSKIQNIYNSADYVAHLETDIRMKDNKTVENLIEEMRTYPVIIYQGPEKLQDPSQQKTATLILCGSLFKSGGKYYLLTAGHIKKGDYTIEKINASFKNGQSGEFEVCGYDSKLDTALLKPKDPEFKFNGRLATFGTSANLKVQQTVVHVGSPLTIPNTCSRGAINNLNVGSDYPGSINKLFKQAHLILHDAKIDGGSSGGPLLNLRGEIVGINVSIFRNLNVWSLSVPIDDIKAVLDDLKNGVQR